MGGFTSIKKRNKLGYIRTQVACVHCRRRKIRCEVAPDDPQRRCVECIKSEKECQYFPVDQQPPVQKKSRQRSTTEKSSSSTPAPSSAASTSAPAAIAAFTGTLSSCQPSILSAEVPPINTGSSVDNQVPSFASDDQNVASADYLATPSLDPSVYWNDFISMSGTSLFGSHVAQDHHQLLNLQPDLWSPGSTSTLVGPIPTDPSTPLLGQPETMSSTQTSLPPLSPLSPLHSAFTIQSAEPPVWPTGSVNINVPQPTRSASLATPTELSTTYTTDQFPVLSPQQYQQHQQEQQMISSSGPRQSMDMNMNVNPRSPIPNPYLNTPSSTPPLRPRDLQTSNTIPPINFTAWQDMANFGINMDTNVVHGLDGRITGTTPYHPIYTSGGMSMGIDMGTTIAHGSELAPDFELGSGSEVRRT